jgi:hypothetical protein
MGLGVFMLDVDDKKVLVEDDGGIEYWRTLEGVETGEDGYVDPDDCSAEPDAPKEKDFWICGLDCGMLN